MAERATRTYYLSKDTHNSLAEGSKPVAMSAAEKALARLTLRQRRMCWELGGSRCGRPWDQDSGSIG